MNVNSAQKVMPAMSTPYRTCPTCYVQKVIGAQQEPQSLTSAHQLLISTNTVVHKKLIVLSALPEITAQKDQPNPLSALQVTSAYPVLLHRQHAQAVGTATRNLTISRKIVPSTITANVALQNPQNVSLKRNISVQLSTQRFQSTVVLVSK